MLIDKYCEVHGLKKCEFKDECDSCETPDIQSYVSIGNGETNYYICHNCIIEKIKGNIDFAVNDGYVSEMEKQELQSQIKKAEAEVTKLRERQVLVEAYYKACEKWFVASGDDFDGWIAKNTHDCFEWQDARNSLIQYDKEREAMKDAMHT